MTIQQEALGNQYIESGLKSGNPRIKLGNISEKNMPILNYVVEGLITAYETGNNSENAKNSLLYIFLPEYNDRAFKAYTSLFKSHNERKMEETYDIVRDIIIDKIHDRLDKMLASYTDRRPGGFARMLVASVHNELKNRLAKNSIKVVDPETGKTTYKTQKLSLDAPRGENDGESTFGDFATSDEEQSSFDANDFGSDIDSGSKIEKAHGDVKNLFAAAFEYLKTQKVSQKELIAGYERMINLKGDKQIAAEYPELFKGPDNVRASIRTGVGRPSRLSTMFNEFIRNNSDIKDFDVTKEVGRKTSKIYEEEARELYEEEFIKRLSEAVNKRIKSLIK